ncbi:SRPBCC domain-containing protein [Mangrovivirga sp. M17]|uniref:SRPBCC domain-containing protein n=1 Tax=Mangrovivirga halotolerans TaxID=2993936 RepID=A0ABT3RRM6_9BACT|nr:SRPBCC domain-containing protein [Mangrovivirga halotolerans]MCX2744024.1 SRPBCC domain-containing protein [Mangrovivirga halotolerans]
MDVIVEQKLDSDCKLVWKVITDPNLMRNWFFENIPDFKAEVGFTTEFPVDSGERIFTHLWKIKEVIPGAKIVYEWRYKEYDGIGEVTFELFHSEFGCIIRITHSGLESFTQEIPEFSEESCRGGWNYFIKDRLTNYLNR